jgi:hypothetical protein
MNMVRKRGTNQLPPRVYTKDVGGYGNVNKVMASARWGAQQVHLIDLRRGKRRPPGLAVFGLTASEMQMAKRVILIHSTSLKRCSMCNHYPIFFRLCDDGKWTVESSLVHTYR